MDIKRRQLLTEPGDALLLSKDSFEALTRFSAWQDATGMAPEDFSTDILCSVPLPNYKTLEPGERRFADVHPQALWHPLFWLPNRVSGMYRLPTGANGELEPESSAIRSIRIALEVTASGLYNIESAGWVDILATVGIDVENPDDVERIAAWQSGGVDDALDSIDLDSYLTLSNNPNWAMESALALAEPLNRAQWALLSDSLFSRLDEVASPISGEPITLDSLREETAMVSLLASLHLQSVPDDVIDPSAFWEDLESIAKNGAFATVNDFLDGPVSDAMAWLHRVREAHWGAIDELNASATASVA